MRVLMLLCIDVPMAVSDSWHASSPGIVIATGVTGFGGWAAGITWIVIASFIAVTVPFAFGVVVQCVKQWKIAAIEVAMAQRSSDIRVSARRDADDKRPVFPPKTDGLRILVPDTRPSG